MKKIRVILIDPEHKTVTEEVVEPTCQGFYKLLDCDLIEAVHPPFLNRREQHFMYVDEEGLYKPKLHWFVVGNYAQPLTGKAVILRSTPDGDDRPATMRIEDIRNNIYFLPDKTATK